MILDYYIDATCSITKEKEASQYNQKPYLLNLSNINVGFREPDEREPVTPPRNKLENIVSYRIT